MKHKNRFLKYSLIFLYLLLFSYLSSAQTSGFIAGRILDSADGSPLPGANVLVKGTLLGASTDLQGRFRISNIPPGTITVRVSYLGYESAEQQVSVSTGVTATLEVRLSQTAVTVQGVTVTAQLKGQQEAINQQVSSNSIVNVVSQERIRELPDQNAAESIARLPGISVVRDGGEAQKVIIRGLDPKFNNITINGEKVPSTDLVDRSVDLSAVSSDMLAGIEVYKSPTPDRDGDALGGTINFAMKKAPDELFGDVRVQGGYNALEKDYGNYRTSVNLSKRFLDNGLGVVVTGSVQRANRGSDGQNNSYSIPYDPASGELITYRDDKMKLSDRREIRKRYGSSAVLDFNAGENHSFFVTGFWSRTDRNEERRIEEINTRDNRLIYDYQDHTIGTRIYSVGLDGKHLFFLPLIGPLDLNWHAASSESNQENPFDLETTFRQTGGLNALVTDQGPDALMASVTPDLSQTTLYDMTFSSSNLLDKNQTLQLNAKTAYNFGNLVSGSLKFGGKLTMKARYRNHDQILSNTTMWTGLGVDIFNKPSAFYRSFDLMPDVNHRILMSNFFSQDDLISPFLRGQYPSWPTLGGSSIHDFWDNMHHLVTSRGALFDTSMTAAGDAQVVAESYNAHEDILAGYGMTELNIGPNLMIVPGLRYEQTKNNYKGVYGTNIISSEDIPSIVRVRDSTGDRTYGTYLPMVQARVSILDQMNIRVSAARTLSRPNFYDLVPYQIVSTSGTVATINEGNPDLLPVTAWNYDVYLSLFNQYGLFTVGWFSKKVDNVSYIRTSYITSGKYKGYQLTQPVNAADPSTVYGGEVEVQANLTLLPSPFDGIVVSGNLSVLKSRTVVPRFYVENKRIPTPPFLIVNVVDTVRELPMPGQANLMANFTIGYERQGFSGRLSLVYQGKSLAVIGTRAETDGYVNPYYRWDLALQQKLYGGLSVFLNVNNLSSVTERSSNERYLTTELYYGWTTDFGIRYKF